VIINTLHDTLTATSQCDSVIITTLSRTLLTDRITTDWCSHQLPHIDVNATSNDSTLNGKLTTEPAVQLVGDRSFHCTLPPSLHQKCISKMKWNDPSPKQPQVYNCIKNVQSSPQQCPKQHTPASKMASTNTAPALLWWELFNCNSNKNSNKISHISTHFC